MTAEVKGRTLEGSPGFVHRGLRHIKKQSGGERQSAEGEECDRLLSEVQQPKHSLLMLFLLIPLSTNISSLFNMRKHKKA